MDKVNLSPEPCLNKDFRMERPMHGTAVGDFEQALSLVIRQVADEFDFPLDTIHFAFLCLTGLAIFGVDLLVLKPDDNLLYRPFFAVCISSFRLENCVSVWP